LMRPQLVCCVIVLHHLTLALDTHSEKVMQAAIDEYCKSVQNGVTRVIIAHRLSTIRNADVIVVIKDGSVAEMGSHAVGCIFHSPTHVKRSLFKDMASTTTFVVAACPDLALMLTAASRTPKQ
jgi:ABC-type transport system involved in cytochrome bd biosynthesis fused ATPase/permease subunit